jgi:succinate-semialdehyde dehydrogenase/glutarate-semialdehyde dehydrogenase
MTTTRMPGLPTVGTRPPWITPAVVDRLAALVAGRSGEPIETLSPHDDLPVATLATSTVDDVAAAVHAARGAGMAWRARHPQQRATVVLRFHDLLLERQDQVIDLIQLEVGKSRFSAWQEILQVATLARHYARKAEHYLADRSVRGAIPGLTKVKEVRVPKGVVGIVSPWNYPLYLGVGDVIPALLGGNTVVSKADSQSPLSLLWTRELFLEAGLPADAWGVVAGSGSVVGTALIDQVDYVCFTGSTATGRRVAAQAGERLIGCSLELGGKNPLIVRADADLDKAVAGTIAAAFGNSGQMCIHIERVIVHRDVYDEFKDKLAAATRAMTVAQTYDYSADMGTLVSAAQLAAVRAHVDDAVAHGATVVAGGRPLPDVGPFAHEPTILEGVTPQMAVCAEETFGPVISLYRAKDDVDALRRANEGSYGLSASIWSRDVTEAEHWARQIRAGAVNINDGAAAAAGSIEAGMGGMGDSGLGRRHGPEGIRKYTETQTVATQRVMPLGPPPQLGVERFVALTNRQLAALRKLRVR